jgi:hypothetical protein
LFEKLKIPGTPTIYVNGYKLPREYKVNDIEYFTDEITSLTMERKGQEACSHCKLTASRPALSLKERRYKDGLKIRMRNLYSLPLIG